MRKGQALVEFALFLPILLILLAGLVELGFLIYDVHWLESVTREVARCAAKGVDYHRGELETGSIALASALGYGLEEDSSAIRLYYVHLSEDDGIAYVLGEEVVGYGRVSEVEYEDPDKTALLSEHQKIINITLDRNMRPPSAVWVFVDATYWRETRLGLFDPLLEKIVQMPTPIHARAVFRVGYIRRLEIAP